MSLELYALYIFLISIINGISFTTIDLNRTSYICPNSETCIVNCYGNEVCKGMTITCPSDASCLINCQPNPLTGTFADRQLQLNACQFATINAPITPILNLKCQHSGCKNLTINMNNGGQLTIDEVYIGTFTGTQAMQSLIVNGANLTSFKLNAKKDQALTRSKLYLKNTQLIEITLSLDDSITNPGITKYLSKGSILDASNAGNVKMICGKVGCTEFNKIDVSNANLFNLTCNSYGSCFKIGSIYCPHNGPKGDPKCLIFVDINEIGSFSYTKVYAIEGWYDFKLTCIGQELGKCNKPIKAPLNGTQGGGISQWNELYCQTTFNKTCLFGRDPSDNKIKCGTDNPSADALIYGSNEYNCDTYYLPSTTPTIIPTLMPSINTKEPTYIPTINTIEPTILTNIPTIITNNPTINTLITTRNALQTSPNTNITIYILIIGGIILCFGICVALLCCYQCYKNKQTNKKKELQTSQTIQNMVDKALKKYASEMEQKQQQQQQEIERQNTNTYQEGGYADNTTARIVSYDTSMNYSNGNIKEEQPKIEMYENNNIDQNQNKIMIPNRSDSFEDDEKEIRPKSKPTRGGNEYFPDDIDDEYEGLGKNDEGLGSNINNNKNNKKKNKKKLNLMDPKINKSQNMTPQGYMGQSPNKKNNKNINISPRDDPDAGKNLLSDPYNNNNNNNNDNNIMWSNNVNKNINDIEQPQSNKTTSTFKTLYNQKNQEFDDDDKQIELPSDEDSNDIDIVYNDNNNNKIENKKNNIFSKYNKKKVIQRESLPSQSIASAINEVEPYDIGGVSNVMTSPALKRPSFANNQKSELTIPAIKEETDNDNNTDSENENINHQIDDARKIEFLQKMNPESKLSLGMPSEISDIQD